MNISEIKHLPKSPWIYKYFDKDWKLLYIGKSINLFARVHSYFNGKSKLNFAKKKMVDQIHTIEYIVVNNERESLLLETNLIKKHKPKFNILMKDDKNHLYIKITHEEFPKIIKTRISPSSVTKNRSGEYFGPYINGKYVNQILAFLKKYFGYWVGDQHFFQQKSGYNLDTYIFWDRSEWDRSQKERYFEIISQIKSFLKWDFASIVSSLEEKMKEYAKNLRFEEAEKIKQQIEAIRSLKIQQVARDGVSGDYDVVNYIQKYDSFFISLIQIRDSNITGMENYQVETSLEEGEDEIIRFFIENNIVAKFLEESSWEKYPYTMLLPKKISENIQVNIEVPKIWAKHELIKLCYKNVYEFAHKKHLASLSTKNFTKQNMKNLLHILWYKRINKDIYFECNDISHISGHHTVASRSVIENGKTANSKYRKYNISSLGEGKIDDFNSMREVITRRIQEIKKSEFTPDLIIIDGWKWQLSSVMEIISQYNMQNILQVVSIAKREEELFLPWKSASIILSKESSELRMIQKIRDESHRFAITFNRDKRIKSMKKNILESIPGIWPKTRKKILNKYGSIEDLQNSDKEGVLKFLWKSVFENLENHGIL